MIDLEALLKPISDESPSGPDVRFDSESDVFDTAKEQRRELDPALDPNGKGKEADWPGAAKTCAEALAEKTKDLELAAWLTEARIRTDGLVSLAKGLELMRGLLEGFWEDLHPGVDEDGITLPVRGRPLGWLGSSGFVRSVADAPLAPGAAVDTSWTSRVGAASLADQTLSEERRNELAASGQISTQEWEAGLSSAPVEDLRAQHDHLARALAELRSIEAFCGERFGEEEPPNLYPLQTQLDDMIELLVAKGAGPMTEPESAGEAEDAATAAPAAEAPAAGATPAAAAAGPLANRQEALKRLAEVGEYFKRNEPHSPISLLVARAVRWGSMPFEEVVRDLARDADLGRIWETLGVGSSGSSGSKDE